MENPLKPSPTCNQRDITEDGSGTTIACLCTTNYCNGGNDQFHKNENTKSSKKQSKKPKFLKSPSTKTTKAPQEFTSKQGNNLHQILRSLILYLLSDKSCPKNFAKIGGSCYFISKERVGWVEARKKCEAQDSMLVALESETINEELVRIVKESSKRHYAEFWTAGNDIEEEGVWEWAGVRSIVPDYGWTEDPYYSIEENCQLWVVELRTRGRYSDGWHGASCCNSAQYICQIRK